MTDAAGREHYIPIRRRDLLDLCCRDLGTDHEAIRWFQKLATMLAATFHYEHFRHLNELKDAYAPFDPDSAAVRLRTYSADERARLLDDFDRQFVQLMERANFTRLTMAEIAELAKGVSEWGLNMDVDFGIFERLEVFVRGDTMGTRSIRRWWTFWRRDTVQLQVYQRLVILVKLKPSSRLPAEIDTNTLFLKVFKDIPKVDMEMLLPGTRMRMPLFSRVKLGGSLISSLVWILYNMINELIAFARTLSFALILGPLSALLGYGYKQWFGYQSTRTVFGLRLAEHLYYQTLGTNQSVLSHLLDEAEEQEFRESLLAYYYLWRHAGSDGWTRRQLDEFVEKDLTRLAGIHVDFEINDAMGKLERLKLVRHCEDRYSAEPIEQALAALDQAWDAYFGYNKI